MTLTVEAEGSEGTQALLVLPRTFCLKIITWPMPHDRIVEYRPIVELHGFTALHILLQAHTLDTRALRFVDRASRYIRVM